MSPQRSLAILVAAVMMSLVILAHASPPDPDWIGGFWDNGDYDDVVLLVTSGVGAAESHLMAEARPVVLVSALVSAPGENRLPAHPRSSAPTRAPPAP
jgi:hypothetical protein